MLFRSGQGDSTGKVYATCVEQASDEDHFFRTERPNSFAFVDRTDVVNLNAYVSGGVRTVEGSYSYIFGVGQCRARLLYADIQIRLCHLCQCVQTSLEIFFLAFQNKFEISSQWVSVKCRNEDSFRFGIRVREIGRASWWEKVLVSEVAVS